MIKQKAKQPGRNMSKIVSVFTLLMALFLSSGCTTPAKPGSTQSDQIDCSIMYDAGSTGTRLYVYQKSTTGWIKHTGPGATALADPIRGIHGKTMADADEVVDEIVRSLEKIRFDGPPNKNGEPLWPAFDWRELCANPDVNVFGTAGMRLAEQLDGRDSEAIWRMLNDRLSAYAGIPVTTRTLSGFEEGLFAWLATREKQADGKFGVAEMGGASMQVTFPCSSCESSKQIRVKDETVSIFSHSFLGRGQDEAWKQFGSAPACARGAGVGNPDWESADCAVAITGLSTAVADVRRAIDSVDGLRWYLSDAFRYMRATDIEQFCREGVDSGYQPVSSCFRAVYLQKVLRELRVPANSQHSKVDWTLGAVICTATRCME